MKNFCKVLTAIIIWGGTALLAHLFHSYGILNGWGAGLMFFADVLLTAGLWDF